MRFSIVIPTFNRQQLLREALASIRSQTFGDWEVIVVDDGSSPPVSAEQVKSVAGPVSQLLRHDTPRGLPAANNAGLVHASGDIVTYLDDDDLLVPHALENLDALFRIHSDLDCIFLIVLAFGSNAQDANANQAAALRKVLAAANAKEDDDLWILGPGTFEALLNAIPIAFQRPAATRHAWQVVGHFNDAAPFPRSEWSVRAAARGRIALTKRPLQLWRVDNQNYFSVPAKYMLGIDARLATLHALLQRYQDSSEANSDKARAVRLRIGDAYFDKAWSALTKEGRSDWHSMAQSFRFHPRPRLVRFAIRNLLIWTASCKRPAR